MQWTREQTEAIYKKGTNIIVSAGAGSGKTAVLTERTIQTLKSGVRIDQMIILTFTKAAAFSMKEKIKKRLKKETDSFLKEQLQLIEQASICTFDSFSLDLVKKYSDVLNIDANINISDPVLIANVKNHIIDEVFDSFYENPNFLKLLDTYTVKDDKTLRNDLISILSSLDKIYDIDSFLNDYMVKNFNDEKIDQNINEYIALINQKYEEFKEKILILKRYVSSKSEEKILGSLELLMNVQEYADYSCFNMSFPRCSSKDESFKEILSEVKDIFNEIKEYIAYDSIAEMKSDILITKPYIEIIIEVLKKIVAEINRYKQDNNLYEFNDISRLAIKLLKENDDICEYYKENIKEIMIDEYQDTNDIGDYFISLIANNNVFMVGDVKQSIYRFRNANPKIFIQKYNDYNKNIGGYKIDLNKNFRSRLEVIENINKIFSKIMDESIGGANYLAEHLMIFGQEKYQNNNQDNNLEILNYDINDYYGFKKSEVEAFILARDIKDKVAGKYQIFDLETDSFRDIHYSDCAILLSQKSEFELYKKVFDYFKIPLTIHKDEDLSLSTELIVIKNIIKLIGYYQGIDFDQALIKTFMSVARSFVLNMSDNDIFEIILKSKNNCLFSNIPESLLEKITYLSNYSKEHSISELIIEILNIFEIYSLISKIGDIKTITSKIDYLITVAESLETSDYHLEEFIAYLISTTDESINFTISLDKDETVGVNLMTIHKSKGLEYPICYFADLDKRFSTRDIKPRFLLDSKYGFIAPVFKEGIATTIYKDLLKNEFMTEEISERIRVLYVALTRAKEKIIFVGNLNKDVETKNNLIIDKNIRLRYRSFNDILLSIKGILKDYIKDITDLNITREYEYYQNELKDEVINNYQTIDIDIEKEDITDEHFSHQLSSLISNKQLELGTRIHEYLENIDFNDINCLNDFDIEEFFKEKIRIIFTMPFIKKDAIYHHEYEFIYNDSGKDLHGIIDLLVETDDELIIVDYKLSDIEASYYQDQVKGYMNYLKTISNKNIKGYLYSIINNVYLEVK